MPTTRPRHVVTETDDLARALDAAARRWPEDGQSRAKLLLHLVYEGQRALQDEAAAKAADRRAAIERTTGILTGAYGPGYLERLREDWDE